MRSSRALLLKVKRNAKRIDIVVVSVVDKTIARLSFLDLQSHLDRLERRKAC